MGSGMNSLSRNRTRLLTIHQTENQFPAIMPEQADATEHRKEQT